MIPIKYILLHYNTVKNSLQQDSCNLENPVSQTFIKIEFDPYLDLLGFFLLLSKLKCANSSRLAVFHLEKPVVVWHGGMAQIAIEVHAVNLIELS